MQTLDQLQTELATVRTAIQAAYSGTEYEITTGQTQRRLKRQPLDVLLAREKELIRAITAITGQGSGRVFHGVPMP